MKFRSCLLMACMLAVPAAAMFSHRVPPAVRKACWRAVSSPLEAGCAWLKSCVSPASTASEPPPAAGEPPAAAVPIAAVAAAPAGTTAGPNAPLPPPAAIVRQEHEPDPIQLQLAALGATTVECRPLDGDGGAHVASCHVAIDATGQLLRVFQAVGAEPRAALHALLDDVAAWRRRGSGPERLGSGGPPVGGTRQ